MKKILSLSTLCAIFILSACTEEEIADFFGNKNEIAVSGKTVNNSDTAEPDVTVEVVYAAPGDPSNPVASSDDNGDFSLQVRESDSFYLLASKNGFVATSTKTTSLNADESGIVIGIVTETEAQDIINTAFTFAPQLFNHAWLTVDVVTTGGDEVNNQAVLLSPASAAATYTACDGSDSFETETTGAPCVTDREGPMFIAYYDYAGETVVTVGDESQTATFRPGEITTLTFTLP